MYNYYLQGFYFLYLPKSDVSSADPNQPEKMNKAIIYGPVIAVVAVASLSFFVYRLLLKKRLNCKLDFELLLRLTGNINVMF